MAVVCFRGTKQIRDWMTNLAIQPVPIKDPRTGAIIGNMHKGFHDAYMSVHADILDRLEGHEDLPLYITEPLLGWSDRSSRHMVPKLTAARCLLYVWRTPRRRPRLDRPL